MDLRTWLLNNAFTDNGNQINGRWPKKSAERVKELLDATAFFPFEVALVDRVHAFLNGQTELYHCVECGAELLPKTRNPQIFCGQSCVHKNTRVISKTIKTNLERYNVENTYQSEEIKERIRQTNIERYGVEHAMQSDEVREKAKQTNLERYGVEHHSKSIDFHEKVKQTNLERYGVKNTYQSEEIKERIRQTNIERYGVENAMQSDEVKEKAKQTNLERYGVKNTYQSEEFKIKAKQTNLERYGVEYHSQSHFSSQQLECLNNKEWMSAKYAEVMTDGIMTELNVSQSTVSKYLRLHKIKLTRSQSAVELSLINWLKSLEIEIITSDRTLIYPKELDIYLPEFKIAIEYDGVFWHSELQGKDKNYHLDKTELCADKGIQLLHIFSTDDLEIWKSVILSKIGRVQRIYARKTTIKEVSNQEEREFLRENHLQGAVNSSLALGLYFNNQLVSLMTFGKSRFNQHYEWELLRFCTKKGYQVVGGASKLMKHSGIKNCISYANRRWSNGRLYESIGLKKIGVSSPNYFYTEDYLELHSRNQFQKHKLSERLEAFNPELSEWQNMQNHGYDRIWDCGNLVYVIEP